MPGAHVFGRFELRPDERRLLEAGRTVAIGARAFDLLLALLDRRDRVVSKDELLACVWPSSVVEEGNLTVHVSTLRRLLGAEAIATVPGRGYRFTRPCTTVELHVVPPGRRTADDGPSIEVLPFEDASIDADGRPLAAGIADALTTGLCRSGAYAVIECGDSRPGRDRTGPGEAPPLDARPRFVLRGRLQRAGGRVRVWVRLIASDTGEHVWAASVDGRTGEPFTLQDRVVRHVLGGIRPVVQRLEVERALRKPPAELDARDLRLRAVPQVWALERDANERAVAMLDAALAIDPADPQVLAMLGWCHAQRAVYNWTADFDGARALALRYAEAVPARAAGDPSILAMLGNVHSFVRDQARARTLLERALGIDRSAAWAWTRLGWVELYTDRPERAMRRFRHALRLSPLDRMTFNTLGGLGCAYESIGRFDLAGECFERALRLSPKAAWLLRPLVSSLVGAGRLDEAARARERLLEQYPGYSIASFRRAHVFSEATLDAYSGRLRLAGLPD